VSWLRASYDSVRGPISTYWRVSGERLQLDVTVPANTRALVHVPAVNARSVTEGGRPALETPGIRYVGMANGHAVFEVGGGTYRFGSRTVTARQRTASGKVVTGCPARTDGPSTVRGMHNGPGQTPPEDRS
jgi:hypothetical protein